MDLTSSESALANEIQVPEIRRGWLSPLVLVFISCFAVYGAVFGCLGVLGVDFISRLRTDQGTFGTALLASPLASVGVLTFSGRLQRLLGNRRIIISGIALLGCSIALLASVTTIVGLVGALLFQGAGSAFLDTGLNAATMEWEQSRKRHAMSQMYAVYAGGSVAGALSTGALRQFHVGYPHILLVFALFCVVLCGCALLVRFGGTQPDRTADGAKKTSLGGAAALITLTVLALLGVFGDSMTGGWASIHLESLHAPAFITGTLIAIFNVTTVCGRLLNAPLITRVGPRVSLIVSGVGMLTGAALLAVPHSVPTTVAAFGPMGIAGAGVVPTALSAAAHRWPAATGQVAGTIMIGSYIGYMICPPMVGWLSELGARTAIVWHGMTSLGISMLLVAGLSGIGILLLGRRAA